MPEPDSHLVLANARAGSTERVTVAAAVARLAEFAPTELRWTSGPDEFRSAVGAAPATARLVVAGGDGSVHLALQTLDSLDRTDDPIGIVPLGTGNDFARNHDLPLDPVEAADLVVEGVPTTVPVIELRGLPDDRVELVANNLHVGLGVDAARRAKRLKPVLGRLAYPVATGFEALRHDGTTLRISVDGHEVWDRAALAALVLLGPNMGGGIELGDTSPDRIDLIVIEPADARGQVRLVRDALRSRVTDGDRAHRWSGTTVTLSRSADIDADVDGELAHFSAPVEMTYRPGGWSILKPA